MSRFVFAGNEIIPGTVVMTADGTITPKDDLRVILNISGGGTVSLSDGTDVTQRIEIVNVNADPCSFTYKGTGGSTTASIYTNTGIRLLWVGSYWETSMSTAVTGIDDNGQPFAYNIDSMVEAGGVINLTGTDANGNPFDYGLGKLVTVANENNYSTEEVKTSKTWIDGKPIYRKVVPLTSPITATGTAINIGTLTNNLDLIISYSGWCVLDNSAIMFIGTTWTTSQYLEMLVNSDKTITLYSNYNRTVNRPVVLIFEYTKTTDA